MSQTAILVCEDLQAQEQRLTKLLDFFGVPWKRIGPDALWNYSPAGEGYCVFCAMGLLGRELEARGDVISLPPLLRRSDSAYLFGGNDPAAACFLLRWLTQCPSARIVQSQGNEGLFSVACGQAEVCGPMSGLKVSVARTSRYSIMEIPHPAREFDALISGKEGHVFGSINLEGIRCFLDPCLSLIDIERTVEKGFFDVRDYFCSAVPIVVYLRFAFNNMTGSPGENGACLIVDDPVLRPRYGFFDFQQIVALGLKHQFTCSIAFIPWNWRRSRPSVVELFKRHSNTLSLCIHGCDHTAGEFGTGSAATLNAQAKMAVERMERHRHLTGLEHEPLMVFPQGVFSAEAPAVLKHNGFMAAINTEVSPVNRPFRTEIREVWKTAVMKYADFPIYTRRYPSHGLCNFAFDLLLGKPCLIVTHHEDFHHDCRELVDFIDQISSLKALLTWRPLGDVIRRAYRQRLRGDGVLKVTMFGSEIVIKNPDAISRHVVVEKIEHNPGGIDRVEAAGSCMTVLHDHDRLRLELDLAPTQSAHIRIRFKDIYGSARPGITLAGRVKPLARRYLSEFRDEARACAPWVHALTAKTRELLHGVRHSKHA